MWGLNDVNDLSGLEIGSGSTCKIKKMCDHQLLHIL